MRTLFVMGVTAAACSNSNPDGSTPSPDGDTDDRPPVTGPTPGTTPIAAAPLELCINEFMPSNATSWADETGAFPDWIEIHNPGDADVDLFEWSLTDDRDDPAKHRFGESLVVAPGAFLVLSADALPDLGPTHLSFSLDETGEEVALYRLSDLSAEVVAYGAVVEDIAVARAEDCGPIEGWEHVFAGTPGASNTATE